MSSWPKAAVATVVATATALACTVVAAQGAGFPGIGRTATPKEVAAWDIDVRADFKGLPPGSGSVARGQEVWEAKCASCHGVFGESGEVFNPLVGGTTKADIERGRVARLTDGSYPGRTSMMKISQVSSLWDYIHRAMPWNQPKSLSADEVYATTAYLLHLGDVLPADFVLSDRNIAEVQRHLPNRDGLTTKHGLWPGKELGGTGKPDVQGSSCMKDCGAEPQLASFLPDFARDAHGNLAEQNREVGAQRGADTRRSGVTPPQSAANSTPSLDPGAAQAALALLSKHNCTACHAVDSKLVGPALRDVAKKHAGRGDAVEYLVAKIHAGGSGIWGAIPMPPQHLPEADARAIARWLADGAPSR